MALCIRWPENMMFKGYIIDRYITMLIILFCYDISMVCLENEIMYDHSFELSDEAMSKDFLILPPLHI